MKNLINKAKYVMQGEDGASNLELVIWFSVVLVIGTALFAFRDKITTFITGAGNQVGALNLK